MLRRQRKHLQIFPAQDNNMENIKSEQGCFALLMIDPYNDFLSEKGLLNIYYRQLASSSNNIIY